MEQPAVADDAGLDCVRQHEHHDVVDLPPGALPTLGEDPSLGHRPEHRRQAGQLADPLAQLEGLPHAQVQWRHGALDGVDRTLTADTAGLEGVGVVRAGGDHAAHEAVEGRPHVARRRGDPIAHHDLARPVDHAGRQAVGADVLAPEVDLGQLAVGELQDQLVHAEPEHRL